MEVGCEISFSHSSSTPVLKYCNGRLTCLQFKEGRKLVARAILVYRQVSKLVSVMSYNMG